jgi:PIN domain nuclease of toxin-antitoxin system
LRLLLDTHIWLWFFQGSGRLAKATAKQLRDSENELWLSPVSTWEAATLHRKGRIAIHESLADWLHRMTIGMHEAPLTHEISIASSLLDLHEDPADRLIVATAQILDLTLVTADDRLLGLGKIRTLANR